MFGEALFAAAGSYREFLGNCFFSIAPLISRDKSKFLASGATIVIPDSLPGIPGKAE
jgi:hypothetical protein